MKTATDSFRTVPGRGSVGRDNERAGNGETVQVHLREGRDGSFAYARNTLTYIPPRAARQLVPSPRPGPHVAPARNDPPFGPVDANPLQPNDGAPGTVRVPPRQHQGRSQLPRRPHDDRQTEGAARAGPAPAAAARAQQGTGEDREAAADAVPHAHQPRAAGVRVPGVGDADRDSVHGGARVRRAPSHDFENVLPAAEVERAAEFGRAAGEHEGARRRGGEGDEERALGGL